LAESSDQASWSLLCRGSSEQVIEPEDEVVDSESIRSGNVLALYIFFKHVQCTINTACMPYMVPDPVQIASLEAMVLHRVGWVWK